MSRIANLYQEAMDILNRKHMPGINKRLDARENAGAVTFTVNPSELELLKLLVSDRIGELNTQHFEATHDETETNAVELAHTIAWIHFQELEAYRLLDKLNNKKRT